MGQSQFEPGADRPHFGPSRSFDRYKSAKFTMNHRNPVCPLFIAMEGSVSMTVSLGRTHRQRRAP